MRRDPDPDTERRRVRVQQTFAWATLLVLLALVVALSLWVSSFTLSNLDQPLVSAGTVILWVVEWSAVVLVVGFLVAPWRVRTASTCTERGEWGPRRWQTMCVRIIGSGFVSTALLFAIETVRRADDWNLPPSVGPILLALLAAGTLIGILILLSADRFTLTADRTEIVFRATWRTMRTSWADVTSIRVERGPHRDMLIIVDSQGDELRALFYDPALTPLETVKARLDDLRASA